MITDYYRNLSAYIQSHPLNITSSVAYIQCGVKTVFPNGYVDTNTALWYESGQDERHPYWLRSGLTTKIGSGTTAPTATDTSPDVDETSNFINYVETFNTTAENGKIVTTAVVTGTNNTASDITITEIMLYKGCIGNNGNFITVLVPITRELLQTPITVPPNKGFTLTFEWVDQ